ncbi:pyridoxamine 5'-phosphate oxidase family protein [Flavobacteriaceae bacterium]|jgi:pyridoxine/pyridoxamine 5'-phosphate oxidase|nr:pyridoxamine 5'-phosphate oxidase family protein [Flavobacteriaceae bacterium]|tara:strand:+ start:544 stop:1080 length:537 start_codon:yes stop_codon:yes gene_type:complete
MLDSILNECKEQWVSAKKKKNHPFRFFTLATLDNDGSPHLRTVVLRGFDSELLNFIVYTDLRSKKVNELKMDKRAQFLFYDPKRMLQIIVGVSHIESNLDDFIYKSIPEQSKKDYAAVEVPGSKIKSPEKVQYNFSKGHFTQLIFKAESIEYLRLKRPNHIRASFNLINNWEGNFIVP